MMPTISGGLGPKGRSEWAQGGGVAARTAVDWTQPQYATPHVPPKQVFGRKVQPQLTDVPQLPERMIRVRAKPPATYYTTDGMPIPAAEWATVPISPTLLQAIKDGDLERGTDPDEGPRPQQRPPRRHHVEAATPPSPPPSSN